ncbi:four helix bundle protein [Kiritimatiella glycovorans]|uniref:four helix bundle protein n=1 Tax=Kiritimatiella glycovorans TaxID=1307763 RepID=UPI00093C24BC|nr:four helix bundle protein [Kiritimatiella glycovorans]
MRTRTTNLAVHVIRLYLSLSRSSRYDIQVAGKQILRSGTSIAANYREASRARTKAEFISKIEICTQEADESLLWIELLVRGCGISEDRCHPIEEELNELISIFVTMSKNAKGGKT